MVGSITPRSVLEGKEAVATYATSVLLQQDNPDGTTTTSHTLHWSDASSYDDAIASAVSNAKRLKPHLNVVDVICGNLATGRHKRVAFAGETSATAY